MLHFKHLEKQEQEKPQTSRRREVIMIRVEVNEIETSLKTVQRINETKSWFYEKINKVDNPLENLNKMRRKRPKLIKLEMKEGIP
jgi:archaellum component FlaC